MAPNSESIEQFADWCELHVENRRGREIGMTFASILRAYGQLASLPIDADEGEQARLNDRAERLLLELSTRFLVAYGCGKDMTGQLATIDSQCTNMIYDDGRSQRQDTAKEFTNHK